MRSRIHQVEQHKLSVPGIVAMTLASNHHFPRHTHEQFGIGVMAFGAHRSWSDMGYVSAGAGEVVMVNPGEIHDGAPLEEAVRGWRMIYFIDNAPSTLMKSLVPFGPVSFSQKGPCSRSMRSWMSKNGQHNRSPATHSATIAIVFGSDGNRNSYPSDNSRTSFFKLRSAGPSTTKCRRLASRSSAKRSQARMPSWVRAEPPPSGFTSAQPLPDLSADVLANTSVCGNANASPIRIDTMQFRLFMI